MASSAVISAAPLLVAPAAAWGVGADLVARPPAARATSAQQQETADLLVRRASKGWSSRRTPEVRWTTQVTSCAAFHNINAGPAQSWAAAHHVDRLCHVTCHTALHHPTPRQPARGAMHTCAAYTGTLLGIASHRTAPRAPHTAWHYHSHCPLTPAPPYLGTMPAVPTPAPGDSGALLRLTIALRDRCFRRVRTAAPHPEQTSATHGGPRIVPRRAALRCPPLCRGKCHHAAPHYTTERHTTPRKHHTA